MPSVFSLPYFLRRAALALIVTSGALAGGVGISGCGGGNNPLPSNLSGSTTPSPAPTLAPTETIVRSAVTVLPDSVQISDVTDTSVTLGGSQVPALAPGAIIVSGQGSGLLRTVVSSQVSGGQTRVQTGQATLEDVFAQASIKISGQSFGVSDFAKMDLAPGVTIVDGDTTGGKAVQGRGRAVSKTFTVTLPPYDLAAGSGQVTTQETLVVTLNLDADIEIDNTGVKHVLFKPSVTGDLTAVARATYKTNFSKSFTYATLDGKPIVVQVGPVPVVFTPHFTLSINASGSADVGLTLTTKAHADATVTTQYERGTGWKTDLDFNKNGSFVAGKNLYATLDADLTPAHVALGLDLYGLATSSIQADYPTINFHLAHESKAPAGIRFTETGTYHGYVNYNVAVLGHTLSSYNSGDFINGSDKWQDLFYPDNGGINLGVQ